MRVYASSDAHALAPVAVTGMFGGMSYTDPQDGLGYVVNLAETVEPRFLA